MVVAIALATHLFALLTAIVIGVRGMRAPYGLAVRDFAALSTALGVAFAAWYAGLLALLTGAAG